MIDLWMKHLLALNCSPLIVDSSNSLGITLDKYLSMQEHISTATKEANYQINILRKLKPFLPHDNIKSVVQALVILRLDYGSATVSFLEPSWRLKGSVLALKPDLSQEQKETNISPDLKFLNWLPYGARIQQNIACITHKALH